MTDPNSIRIFNNSLVKCEFNNIKDRSHRYKLYKTRILSSFSLNTVPQNAIYTVIFDCKLIQEWKGRIGL